MISVVASLGEARDEPTDAVVVVWTPDARSVEQSGAQVLMEYGSFTLARADAAQRAFLEDRFIIEEVPTTIQKGTVGFDTQHGDAAVPASLKAEADDPYQMVQFVGPVHKDWTQWLRSQADILDYVPHNTFIVRVDSDGLGSLDSHEAVTFVGPYHPAYKLHHALPDHGALTLDLQVWRVGDVASTLAEIEAMGGEVLLTSVEGIEPYMRVKIDASRVEELAHVQDVAWIEPVFEGDPLDNENAAWVTQSGNQEGGNSELVDELIGGVQPTGRSVHEAGITGAGQVLAVADGGLDSSGGSFIHEMFDDPDHGAYQFGQINPDHRKVRAYFALTEDGNQRGDFTGHSHGVHTAGSVAGDAPEGDDYATYNLHDGQAFAGDLVKMDVAQGGAFRVPLDYYNAFQPTYEAGARLHSNSYGYPHDNSYNVRARQNDLYTEENPDFLIFRSMGNTAGNTIRPEAVGKNVVGSGATANGAQYENMASFSSRGPTQDGRVKPTFVAPGQAVLSAGLNGGYASLSGTSMSTPTSAGAAGLVREYFEEGWYGDGFNPSSALVRGVLINSAAPIYGQGTDRPGLGGTPFDSQDDLKPNWPNGDQGWGIVRLDNTLRFDGDPHGLFVEDGDSVGTGDEQSYTVSVTNPTEGLKITLAWVDPAAAVGANPALVNDLDLTLSLPDGSHLPGNVFAGVSGGGVLNPLNDVGELIGPFSVPGPADRTNVEEQIVLPVVAPGDYTITVAGANVPSGDQHFALVVTGGI